MCEAHVKDNIRRNFDVKKLKASHKKNLVTFVSGEEIDIMQIKSIISKDGYNIIDFQVIK